MKINSNKNTKITKYMKSEEWDLMELGLQEKKVTLTAGKTFELRMNSYAMCTWKSGNPSVATVNSYGKITAKRKGTAVITATLYGKSFECKVTVK